MLYAPKFPLRFKEQEGFEDVSDLKELIRFHLMNILLTSPGEKISDSNFGVGVRKYLFENMSPGFINNFEDNITSQLQRYAKYIDTESVQIFPFPEQNKIVITITYNIEETKEKDVLNLELSGAPSDGPVY